MMANYGIRNVVCGDLPRGVIIGTVELYDCDEGDWMLREREGGDAAEADEASATSLVQSFLVAVSP